MDDITVLKASAEDSLYFFGTYIIGNEYFVKHVHGELAEWITSPERLRVRKFGDIDIKAKLMLILLPRDTLKTTFVSITYPLWRLCKNPNTRILIDSEARDLSKLILKNQKAIIDSNEWLPKLWGQMNGQDRGQTWNLEAIRIATRTDNLAKEDSVETGGIDVAVTGRHYPIIIMDDLHSERNITSKESIQKVKEHIQLMMPLLEDGGELIIVGTRWSDDDAYDWVMSLKEDNGESLFDIFVHPAYNEDGSAYYPERNSLSTLALKKATMSESLFSCQYLLDPIPEAIAPLKKSDLQYLDVSKIPPNLNRFMMCDTIGDKKSNTGDYFAVCTWGVEPNLNEFGLCKLYLLDGMCGWYDTDQQLQAIISTYMKTRPIEFGIEKSGMNTLQVHLQNSLRNKGLSMITSELKPLARQKEQRIMQFIPYSQNGLIFINKNCNEKFLEEFLYEWSRFPKAKRDDCIDASAYIFDFMTKYPADIYGAKKRTQQRAVNWKIA